MKKIITRLLFVAILLISQISIAVPAYQGLVKLQQPDGSEINAYLFGDERVSWIESEDNYTLMVNEIGYLEYAIINQKGDMTLSGIVAKNISKRSVMDNNFLSTANKKVRYSEEQIDIMLDLTKSMETTKSGAVEGLTVGIRKLLVILVGYQDVPFTTTRQEFENLFNQIGYTANASTGSVRDYFLASSYGKLDLQCTVVGPFTLPNTRKFYGEIRVTIDPITNRTVTTNDINAKQMIIDACNAADASVDYSIFDNDDNLIVDGVHIVYAGKGQHNGGGADAIWAHRSKLGAYEFVSNEGIRIIDYSCASEKNSFDEMSGVGVHSHEFGHVLGLLDYYDYDYQKNGISKTFGEYDIMDAGAYNNDEKTPPIYNAYSKVFLGWASPYIIDSNMLMDITSFPSTDSALIFKINTPTEGEYFLLENKDHSGWNGKVNQLIYYVNSTGVSSGLMAIHVDESPNALGWADNCLNCNPNRNSVKIMSADGNFMGSESSTSWNYSAMSNLFYPGSSNFTALTDQTTTNLLSWNNLPSNVAITNITRFPDKNITFKVNGGADYGVSVHTVGVSQIDYSSATIAGSASASVLGDATIIEQGFVLNTNPYPRVEDTKIAVMGQTPTFNFTLLGLNPGTRYYTRAYGINANGVSYGEQISFITTSAPITNNAIIDSNFAACETGEMPTIIGTDPIGGSGTYLYRWLESTDNVNWTISQNSGINRDYTPSQLTTPRYYKRVVLSAEKSDTSVHIYIPIVPATVAGDVSIENISIEEGGSTGAITITNNVGDVVLWQRKDGNAQWAQIEVGAVSTFSQILETEGTYQYRVRVRNGACPSKQSDAVSVTVMKIGLYDIEVSDNSIIVSPNPSNGEINVNYKNKEVFVGELSLYDINGKQRKKIDNQVLNQGDNRINLNPIDAGSYLLVFKNRNQIMSKIIIINK